MLLLMTRVYRHSFVKVHSLYLHRELYDRYFLQYKDFMRVSGCWWTNQMTQRQVQVLLAGQAFKIDINKGGKSARLSAMLGNSIKE